MTTLDITAEKKFSRYHVVVIILLALTQFTVVLDSIHNTERTLDLDYAWYLKVRFNNNYFESLKKDIRTSPNYNLVKNGFDKNWNSVDTSKIKGIWYSDTTLLKFVQNPSEFNPEPIYLSVDTLTRILDFQLTHL